MWREQQVRRACSCQLLLNATGMLWAQQQQQQQLQHTSGSCQGNAQQSSVGLGAIL
jgi:hypothetical protein